MIKNLPPCVTSTLLSGVKVKARQVSLSLYVAFELENWVTLVDVAGYPCQ